MGKEAAQRSNTRRRHAPGRVTAPVELAYALPLVHASPVPLVSSLRTRHRSPSIVLIAPSETWAPRRRRDVWRHKKTVRRVVHRAEAAEQCAAWSRTTRASECWSRPRSRTPSAKRLLPLATGSGLSLVDLVDLVDLAGDQHPDAFVVPATLDPLADGAVLLDGPLDPGFRS